MSNYFYMTELKKIILAITVFLFSIVAFTQTPPPLGLTASFAIYTSAGAVGNTGFSQITGNIGTNVGAVTGFGNIDGNIHIADATTAQCAIDLNTAYTNINAQVPTTAHSLTLGGGEVLTPAIYVLSGASTCNDTITLDGGGDANACFIFRLDGAFAAAAGSTVILTNGTQACNVFWRIDGATAIAAGSTWKGTLIVSGEIALATGCSIDGRLLDISGAISVSNLKGSTPRGCGEPILNGPNAPNMGTLCSFALLTSAGTVTNTGATNVVNDIGSNSGSVGGYAAAGVVGTIHSIPDAATATASSDLTNIYTYISGLPTDITLLAPTTFGNNLLLTPHVYVMNAAAMLTDTLFLDARGVTTAVFVIRIMGAFTTNANPQVVLLGGANPQNVFWQIEGAATISSSGNFNGIIIANNAAIILNTGVTLNGRAFSTNGNISTSDANITNSSCANLLPIELLSFTAISKISHIQFNWVTASETNNDYFNIERSADAINFTSISKTNGAVNSIQNLSYTAHDLEPLEGISYYRLKQTDFDGKTSSSNLVSVLHNKMNDFIFNIYPNPNNGDLFNFQTYNNTEVIVAIYDMFGKEFYSKGIVVSTNGNDVNSITPSPKLNAGVYLVKATINNKNYIKRLVVSK
jgi:hypothetical protein